MYLDDRPCFQNIAMLIFTIVGLVAVIKTFFWSQENATYHVSYGTFVVSITLYSDYNHVTLYLSNCYNTISSSFNILYPLVLKQKYICVNYRISNCETQTYSDIQVRVQYCALANIPYKIHKPHQQQQRLLSCTR